MNKEKILLAYDDSDAAQAARRWAIQYAQTTSSTIVLLYVVSSLSEWELAAIQVDPGPIRDNFERFLKNEWSEPLRESGIDYETRLLVGRPAESILQCAAAENVSLIAVGMTSRSTVHELIVGTVAGHVLHHARRPVVAVPASWVPGHAS